MQRAFTLIELAVVVAIIATAAAIALPRYASAQNRYRLDGAAQLVARTLDRAARRAEASSRVIEVVIDTSSDVMLVRDAANTSDVIALIHLSDSPWGVDIVAADFGGEQKVRFDAFGLPSSAGGVKLAHSGSGLVVSLSESTGRAIVGSELEVDGVAVGVGR